MEWIAFWAMCAVISLVTSWKCVQVAKYRSSAIQTILSMNPQLDMTQIQNLVDGQNVADSKDDEDE